MLRDKTKPILVRSRMGYKAAAVGGTSAQRSVPQGMRPNKPDAAPQLAITYISGRRNFLRRVLAIASGLRAQCFEKVESLSMGCSGVRLVMVMWG